MSPGVTPMVGVWARNRQFPGFKTTKEACTQPTVESLLFNMFEVVADWRAELLFDPHQEVEKDYPSGRTSSVFGDDRSSGERLWPLNGSGKARSKRERLRTRTLCTWWLASTG